MNCIMTGYYDYVLALIPLAMIGIAGVLSVAGLQLTLAVPAGAGVASLLIGHALFVNGPVSAAPERTTSQTASARQSPVHAD